MIRLQQALKLSQESEQRIRESAQRDRMASEEQVQQLRQELSTANEQARTAALECEQSHRTLDEILSQRLQDEGGVAPTTSERQEVGSVETRAAAVVSILV